MPILGVIWCFIYWKFSWVFQFNSSSSISSLLLSSLTTSSWSILLNRYLSHGTLDDSMSNYLFCPITNFFGTIYNLIKWTPYVFSIIQFNYKYENGNAQFFWTHYSISVLSLGEAYSSLSVTLFFKPDFLLNVEHNSGPRTHACDVFNVSKIFINMHLGFHH